MEDLFRVTPVAEQKVRQQPAKATAQLFEIHVDVVDFETDKLGSVPVARLLRVGVEEKAAILCNLAGEDRRISCIAQDDPGVDAKGHESVFHLETGDEEFAVVKAAPLEIEVGATIDAMIAEADEIEARGFQHMKDFLKGHFAVMGMQGVAVEDTAEFGPPGIVRHRLALSTNGLPGGFLAGKAHEPMVKRPAEPKENSHHHEDGKHTDNLKCSTQPGSFHGARSIAIRAVLAF
jgi:hypothetical protein